jgi:hypothetical protein
MYTLTLKAKISARSTTLEYFTFYDAMTNFLKFHYTLNLEDQINSKTYLAESQSELFALYINKTTKNT